MFKQLLRTWTGHGAEEGRLLARSPSGPSGRQTHPAQRGLLTFLGLRPGLEPRSPCPGQWQAALCHSPAPCLPPLSARALDHLPAEAPEGRGHHCKNPPKHQSLPAPWHFSFCCKAGVRSSRTWPAVGHGPGLPTPRRSSKGTSVESTESQQLCANVHHPHPLTSVVKQVGAAEREPPGIAEHPGRGFCPGCPAQGGGCQVPPA